MASGLSRSSIALAAIAVAAVLLIAVPLPALGVDALLAANFLLAAGLLVLVVAAARPLELRAFPALLLICAILRLSTAVAAARLGLVERGPSPGLGLVEWFVLGGSAAAAGIVFVGLAVVHQLVVARGAERIAEVSARFALDALPGRQLGIDGDVRAGALDAAGARHARAALAHDGQLFAAMDGAMKFVRGEAVAALVLVAVVAVGATLIAVALGQSAAQAAQHAVLFAAAVGVTAQLPALLAALAASLLATRAGAPEPAGLGGALLRQVRQAMGPDHAVDPRIVIEAPPGARVAADGLARRIDEVLADLGLPPQGATFRANAGVTPGDFRVLLDGLAMVETRGLGPEAVDAAVRRHAHALLGIEETQRLLDALAVTHPALVRETVPRGVDTSLFAEALRRLLREGVPIRPLREVLEAVARRPPGDVRAADLTEHIRAARARTLTHRFCGDSRARAIVLDAEAEEAVREGIRGDSVALDPDVAHDLIASVRRHLDKVADAPIVLCAADVRRHVRTLLETDFPDLPVLSYAELLPEVAIAEVGRIPGGQP